MKNPSLLFFTLGGGSGFIGRHLQKLLRSKGYKITLVSRTPGENAITWVCRCHDCLNIVQFTGLHSGVVAYKTFYVTTFDYLNNPVFLYEKSSRVSY